MTAAHDGTARRSADRLRDRWAEDRPTFGVWSMLADPAVAELLAATEFDYVCVDLQHGLGTFSELPMMLQAMRSADRAPVVRVPWNDPAQVMRAVDTGAAAVVVPMVNSEHDARLAASACRFPPAGVRSWGPMWGDSRRDGALPPQQQDDDVLCIVMVETRAGLEAIDDIVAVPGVDAVYIGPNDLALGCGYGRQSYRDSEEVDALIQRIVEACRRAGVVAGLHCSDVEMALHWAGRGVRMLTVATDTTLLRRAAEQTLEGLRASSPG